MNGHAARPRLNLAIDLDGVLTEHPRPLATAASEKFRLDLPERAFVDSAGLNVPHTVRDWVYSDDGPASQLHPAEGAQQFLRDVLDLLGPDNVQIITARSAGSASMTRHWLQRHNFPDVTVLFADDKPTVAAQRGCNVAVEDSIRHARSYSDSGMLCFLISPPDAYTDDLPGVVRVDSLTPIPALLRDEMDRIDDGKNGTAAFAARPRIVISDAIDPGARASLWSKSPKSSMSTAPIPRPCWRCSAMPTP